MKIESQAVLFFLREIESKVSDNLLDKFIYISDVLTGINPDEICG